MKTKINMSNGKQYIINVNPDEFVASNVNDHGSIHEELYQIEPGKYINITQIVSISRFS